MSARFSAVALAPILALASALPLSAAPRDSAPVDLGPILVTTEVVTLTVRPGVTLRYLAIFKPNTLPATAVILFAGGNGLLDINANGKIGTDLEKNFLVRSRARFAGQGLLVAVVDTPGKVLLDGQIRLSPQYAQDIGHVIQDVRKRLKHWHNVKVWLVGTSSGTLSAAGVAARMPLIKAIPPYPAARKEKDNRWRASGIVLTSTQTEYVNEEDLTCGKIVYDAKLSAINVPALLVSHKDDKCLCSPPGAAPNVIAALTSVPANAKHGISFMDGDRPLSPSACQALTPHGFFGIEDTVVKAIADWIQAH